MTESSAGATLTLRGEYITLAHAIKAVGLADTGGQAKLLVREGQATVNGEPTTQPGRKLRAGDRFGMVGGEWTLVAGMYNKEEERFSDNSFVRESPTPNSGE